MSANGHGIIAVTGRGHCKRQVAFLNFRSPISSACLSPASIIGLSHICNILSRASEVGSPTSPPWAPGSDKTRGQGSFGPFTGGLVPNLTILAIATDKKLKKKEMDRTFDPLFTKTG